MASRYRACASRPAAPYKEAARYFISVAATPSLRGAEYFSLTHAETLTDRYSRVKIRKMLRDFIVGAEILILSTTASAHHGAAAEYDLLHPLTLRGVVTEFRYVNPHSQIYFDVTDNNGNVVHWAGELNSPYSLTQDGWTKKRSTEALKAGTPITVIICPGKFGKPVGLAQKIFNAKGEQLLSETNTGLEPDRRPPALK